MSSKKFPRFLSIRSAQTGERLMRFSKKAGSDRRGDPHIFSIFFRKGLKTMANQKCESKNK